MLLGLASYIGNYILVQISQIYTSKTLAEIRPLVRNNYEYPLSLRERSCRATKLTSDMNNLNVLGNVRQTEKF